MTTFELAGQAMLQMQDGNANFARILARFLGRGSAPDQTAFTGATFLEQEPDLANEAHLPPHMGAI